MVQAPWIVAAVAAVHLLADAAGTVDLSNRVEVRGRVTENVTPNPSLDLVDNAVARLGFATRRWTTTLGYSALFTMPDVETGVNAPATGLGPTFIQSGDIGATWHDRSVTLGLAEYGTYGQADFATTGPLPTQTGGAAPPPASVTLLTQPQTMTFGSSRTALTAGEQLSRRARLGLLMEYSLQGGLDAASQAVLPLVRGPRAEITLDESLSRLDVAETRASVQRSDSSTGACPPYVPSSYLVHPFGLCAPTGQIQQVTETWRHEISRRTELSVGTGAAFVQVRFQDMQSGFYTSAFPVALAGLQYVQVIERQRTTFRLDLAVAPFVDLRSGIVDERGQVTGSFRRPQRKVIYSGSLGGARSVDSPYMSPVTVVQATVEAEYQVSPVVGAGAGVRYFWQNQEGVGGGSQSFGTAFVELTVRSPRTRF